MTMEEIQKFFSYNVLNAEWFEFYANIRINNQLFNNFHLIK